MRWFGLIGGMLLACSCSDRGLDADQDKLSCSELTACIYACNFDNECRDDCLVASTHEARVLYDDAQQCVNSICVPLCYGACGGICESNDREGLELCKQCDVDVNALPGTCDGRPNCGVCRDAEQACGFGPGSSP